MPGIITDQDYTKQINDAFSALKYASPQQLQAVAQQVQGNPQSPEALALAMATQFQQESRQPHPAPPQGTVLQQKLSSLAPQGPGIGAVAPNQMAFNQAAQQDPMRNAGIGAAPENTPQMATGGLVSLAHGGPVQGYAGGGSTDVPQPKLSSHEASWGPSWTLDNLVQLDDTPSQAEQDYYETTQPSPSKRRELNAVKADAGDTQTSTDAAGLSDAVDAANQNSDFSYAHEPISNKFPKIDLASMGSTPYTPSSGDGDQTVVVDTGDEATPTPTPTAERTSGGSSSKVPKLSFDKQVEGLASLFAGDHAKAAELKGAMEKRLAESSRSHNLEDVAAGIAGMLSGHGYMSQRIGTGVLTGLASRGQHGTEEDAVQSKIDALGLNEETQSNAARHEALKSVLGTQAKNAEMQQQYMYDLGKIGLENEGKIKAATARAGGQGPKGMASQEDIMQYRDAAQKAAQAEAAGNGKAMNQTWIDNRAEQLFRTYTQYGLGHTPGATTVNTPIPRIAYQPPPAR